MQAKIFDGLCYNNDNVIITIRKLIIGYTLLIDNSE